MYEFLDREASDVMSRPVTIQPGATIAEAEALFEQYGFNLLPVVDEDAELIGVVTSLDLLRAFDFPEDDILPRFDEVMKWTVGKIANENPRTITPRTPLARVIRKMVESGSKSFPVVEGRRLVGVVAREDLMNALRRTSGSEPAP